MGANVCKVAYFKYLYPVAEHALDCRMAFWKENFALSAQFGSKSKILVDIELLKSLKWEGVRWDLRDLTRVLVCKKALRR